MTSWKQGVIFLLRHRWLRLSRPGDFPVGVVMQRPDTRVPILLFVFGGSVSKDCVEFFPGALFIAHGEAYYVTGAVFSGCRKLSVDGAVELIGAGE